MAEIAMRVAKPDLLVDAQINAAGLGMINVFFEDLFVFIDRGLTKRFGKDWLANLPAQDIKSGGVNYRDPAILLKAISKNESSPLRQPIDSFIPAALRKDFYNGLQEILGERHLWLHNSVKSDAEQLTSLVALINKVAWSLELPVVRECNELLTWMNPEETEVPIEAPAPDTSPSELVAQLGQFTKDDEAEVGSPILGPLASYSYTLHTNGSIRNRSTDELLEDLVDGAGTLGALLIARKPSGGRLRITPDGIIAAYFGDSWGFLAQVEPQNWFPDHLS